jgi:hypothetical protein
MLQQMRYTKIYNIQKIYKSHPRAKHAPSGFYPTWTAFTGIYPLKHLRMKQVMLPQVGYSSTCLSTPQNDYSTRYSNDHQIITTP